MVRWSRHGPSSTLSVRDPPIGSPRPSGPYGLPSRTVTDGCEHCDVVGGGDGALGAGCRRRDDRGHKPLSRPGGVLDHCDGRAGPHQDGLRAVRDIRSDPVRRTTDDPYPRYAGLAGRSPRPLRPRSRSSGQPARSTARTSEGRHRARADVRCGTRTSKCPLRSRCSRTLKGRSEPVLRRYSFPGPDMAAKEKHRKSSVVLSRPEFLGTSRKTSYKGRTLN